MWRWLVFIIGAAGVAWLSLMPAASVPEPDYLIPYMDKIVHCGMYGVLMILALWAALDRRRERAVVWVVFLGIAGYGVALEGMQATLTASRVFSWTDVMANILGCGLVLGGYMIVDAG